MILLVGLTETSYAEVSVDNKRKFGSYFKPVKVHNQAEFDYIHLLLSFMGAEKSIRLLDEAKSKAQKTIKLNDLCASIGFAYAHTDFIELNKGFSKNVQYDSQEEISARANRFGLTPDNCAMVRDYIRKNPAEFIEAYSK